MKINKKAILKYLKIILNFIFNPIRLFFMNIKRNFLKEILIGIGILISVFSIIVATAFGDGIERMSKKSIYSKIPATRIKIQGRIFSNPLNKFTGRRVHTQSNISWLFIKKHILSIKGVKSVIPIQNVTYPISAEFPIFGMVMKMDVIANGIPNRLAYQYMFPEFKRMFKWNFRQRGNLVPVLVSEFILDSFQQLAVSSDSPISLTKKFFRATAANGYRGFRFKLFLGKSVFGNKVENPIEVDAVIAGFTDPDITSGLSLPAGLVRRTKLKFQGWRIGNTFESVFINIKDATYFESVVKALYKLNKKYPRQFKLILDREVQKFRNVSKLINEAAKTFKIPIMGFSLIVLFLSMLIVFFAFLYLIRRREKEIGLYRFFGSSRFKIIFLLVLEAIFVAALCASIGYFLSKYFINSYIPDNFDKFLKVLPAQIKTILKTFDMGNKKTFMQLFSFSPSDAFMVCFWTVLASAISAFIPSLIGSYRGLLKTVNS